MLRQLRYIDRGCRAPNLSPSVGRALQTLHRQLPNQFRLVGVVEAQVRAHMTGTLPPPGFAANRQFAMSTSDSPLKLPSKRSEASASFRLRAALSWNAWSKFED